MSKARVEKMKIVFLKKCLEYEARNHPESLERVKKTFEFLREMGFGFEKAWPCKKDELLQAHSEEYVEKIRTGNFFDPDSPNLPKMHAFSLMRPPGHHVGVSGQALNALTLGFCYFNKFVSLHKFPAYPGSGNVSRRNCLNFPLQGASERNYLKVLQKGLNEIKKFGPEVIGVSAGFDTFKKDPIGGLGLGVKSYLKIGKLLGELKIPVFAVLEGGYSDWLAECV